MNIPKRKKYFILGTLLLLIAVCLFVVWPTIKEIKNISTKIYEQKEELEKLYLKGQFLKPTKEQYKKSQSQIPDLSKLIIKKKEELKIITALEEAASRNTLLQEINLQDPEKVTKEKTKPETKYQAIRLIIKVSGNYSNFLKYLVDLELLDYYINIDTIRIFSQDASGFIVTTDNTSSKDVVSVLINAHITREN